jgi:predicted O-linked N-acetylglucosamine transferase (SPINDLY family)
MVRRAQVNDRVLETWAKIMRRVPGSRIYFKSKAFSNNVVTSRLVSRLEQLGISPSRIECSPLIVSTYNHLQMYHKADLSLDTFPYTGTTTTCESLFMGVPCITLRGNTHAHNVGVSLLSAVGLQEMIANSLDVRSRTSLPLTFAPPL